MNKKFKRNINSLKDIFNFIKSFIDEEQLDNDLESPLNLVIEELFTNMVKYSPTSQNKIRLELSRDLEEVKIILSDFNVKPFDIRVAADYDPNKKLEERPIGKIGLHLVNKYVDDIQYDYSDRNSKITLIKYLGK